MVADAEVAGPLLAELSRVSGDRLAFRSAPARMTGGFWAQIFSFELEKPPTPFAGPLVLRVMPDAVSGRRETVVQSWVGDSGYPVAPVLHSGSAHGLGAAFMVMPRIAGRSPLADLRLGPALVGLRRILRSIPELLADATIRLHALDVTPLGELLANVGDRASDGGAAPFLDMVERASVCGSAGFDELIRWFDRNRPVASRKVLCHGDLHPFNLLVDDHGALTVLDWTGATIAAPEMDIGFTAGLLRCAPIAVPRVIAPVIARITDHLADSFVSACHKESPLDASLLAWWEALQYARCLAEVARARVTPGSAVGPTHPFETSAPSMVNRLRGLTQVAVKLPAPRR